MNNKENQLVYIFAMKLDVKQNAMEDRVEA